MEGWPNILRLMSTILGQNGYNVLTAADGNSALEALQASRPDLIIMDIMLPDEPNGPEVIDILKKDSRSQGIPVIFLSGIANKEDSGHPSEVMVAGVNYKAIAKPFNPDKLLQEVKEALSS